MLPLSPPEFANLMAPLGPFPPDRRIAVACSGGADSMALTLLAANWGNVQAFIVDHGLRPGSAAEAALTRQRLAAVNIPARILTLTSLRQGPGLAASAREARYRVLEQACAASGLLDLLLGHHLRDQAETVLMRRLGKSGPAGLAAMAAVTETRGLRLLRPLLSVPPGRFRATLREAGLEWVEDPSNANPATLRARLREQLGDPNGDAPETMALAAESARDAAARREAEAATAAVLAERASLRSEGFALLSPGPIATAALAALIRMVSGARYAAHGDALLRLAACPKPATLGGVRLLRPGRLGDGLLCVREAAAMAPPVPAEPGVIWDRRFRLSLDATPPSGSTLDALGADAAAVRGASDLPAAVLQTLPALRVQGALVAVPHIGYGLPEACALGLFFCPATPAAGAPFGADAASVPGQARGDADRTSDPHV